MSSMSLSFCEKRVSDEGWAVAPLSLRDSPERMYCVGKKPSAAPRISAAPVDSTSDRGRARRCERLLAGMRSCLHSRRKSRHLGIRRMLEVDSEPVFAQKAGLCGPQPPAGIGTDANAPAALV